MRTRQLNMDAVVHTTKNPENMRANLKRVIIEHSVEKDINLAVTEWDEVGVRYCENYGDETCQCGHLIKECIYIENKFTGNECIIGNDCIEYFQGRNADWLFNVCRNLNENTRILVSRDVLYELLYSDIIGYFEFFLYLESSQRQIQDTRSRKFPELQSTNMKTILKIHQNILHRLSLRDADMHTNQHFPEVDLLKMNSILALITNHEQYFLNEYLILMERNQKHELLNIRLYHNSGVYVNITISEYIYLSAFLGIKIITHIGKYVKYAPNIIKHDRVDSIRLANDLVAPILNPFNKEVSI